MGRGDVLRVLLLVDAAQRVLVEVRVLAAVLDPRLVVHAHDVGVLVVRERESRVREEPGRSGRVSGKTSNQLNDSCANVPPGDGVRRELVGGGALEADDRLGVAVGHAVGVVAAVVLVAVGLPALARSLVRRPVRALQQTIIVRIRFSSPPPQPRPPQQIEL